MDFQASNSGSVTDHILNHPQVKPWQPVLVFALFALALGVAGAFVFQRYEAGIKRDKQDELGGIAKLKIAQIANWIDERKDNTRALGDDPLFVAEAEQWMQQGAPSGAAKSKLRQRLQSLLHAHTLSGTIRITLFDSRGMMRLSTSANDWAPREHLSEQVRKSIRTSEILLTEIHRSGGNDGDTLEFDLIAPLLVKRGDRMQPIGAVSIHMNPSRFLFPLIQHWPTPSASAENLLVRRDGDGVLFLNELRHRSNTSLKMRLPLHPQLLGSMAVQGHEGFAEGVDYRGVAVVGVLNKIPGTPWNMVSKIDLAEVNAPIRSLGNWILFLMLCLTGLGGAVIGMWWRKQRLQMRALDDQHALELERQSLSRNLSYLSRYANDIILFINGNGHIVDFNDRALQAYGYTAAEFANIEYSRLRADRNQPLISGLSDEQDQASTMRYECMQVRKNGEVFPVEFSVRNIYIGGEKFAQKIIRDITERKQAEEKLLRLNRSLKLLVDCNSALVLIADEKQLLAEINKLIVETGGYRMAWVGFAGNDPHKCVVSAAAYGHDDGYLETATISWGDNEYGRGPTGTAIRTGSTQANQDVRANPAMSPWRTAALAHNYLSSIALPLNEHNGNCFGALTIYADKPDAFNAEEIALLEELAGNLSYGIKALRSRAERMHAEARLENERTRLRTLVQTIPDLVWLKDTDGVYLACNRRFELFFGAQEADIVGKTDYDFVDSELADCFRLHDRRAMDNTKASINEEWLTFSSDGYRGLFETVKTPMHDSNGKLIGVLGVSRDITERIASEQSIRALNADLDATLKAIPDLLFELDQNGRYINIWAHTPAQLAAQEGQLLGHTVSEMLPPDTAATVMTALRDAEQNGYSQGQVIRLELAQGECWFELSTSVKSVPDGHAKRYIMLSRDITERMLTARTLASSYAQLQKLSLRMESVRAEERAKIALNLHDEMGATLAALKMRIAWLASKLPATAPQLRSEAEQITALVSDGIHTMHQIVSELRPYCMEEEMADAIRKYVNKFQLHTRIECALELNGTSFDLDPDRSLALYRILQESLNNVVSHAKANRVTIHFSERDDSLLMAIRDNGIGFDAAAHKDRSFGLLGIRERALMVGGRARIVSAPGKGTRVTVNIPYQPDHRAGD